MAKVGLAPLGEPSKGRSNTRRLMPTPRPKRKNIPYFAGKGGKGGEFN